MNWNLILLCTLAVIVAYVIVNDAQICSVGHNVQMSQTHRNKGLFRRRTRVSYYMKWVNTQVCCEGYTGSPPSCIDIDECAGDNHYCQQICVNTQGSYMCDCNSGYQLNSDKRTCSDIDECAGDSHYCQQICVNTQGSYMCDCHSGYQLNSDERTCSYSMHQHLTQYMQSVPVNPFFIMTVASLIALGYLVYMYIRRRLSEAISSKPRDWNPHVADLIDKLRDQLIEIYENEYTDSMAMLLQRKFAETKIIKLQLDILEIVYECCLGISSRQVTFTQGTTNPVVLPTEFLKRVKNERQAVKPQLSFILDQVITQIRNKHSIHTDIDDELVKTYIDRCIKLVWLMTIQDPPMYLEFNEERHEHLRAYRQSGPVIAFHVWPSLYLYKGGPLIAEGMAEFKESGGRGEGSNSKKYK